LDLYEFPDEVIRAAGEIKKAWHRYYNELNELTTKGVYTDWSGILSETQLYMLQSDISYMISPKVFNLFARDEIRETCDFLGRGCYHLDGTGQIAHLDALLEIESLKLIQWVPGDGSYDPDEWIGVNSRIMAAGKHLQVMDRNFSQLDRIITYFGHGKNTAVYQINLPATHRKQAYDILRRYDCFGV